MSDLRGLFFYYIGLLPVYVYLKNKILAGLICLEYYYLYIFFNIKIIMLNPAKVPISTPGCFINGGKTKRKRKKINLSQILTFIVFIQLLTLITKMIDLLYFHGCIFKCGRLQSRRL